MYDFESQIVDIPDYPEPGVIFKDITPLFGNPEALKAMTDALAEHFAGMGITKVVGPEARGFMVGVPVAVALGAADRWTAPIQLRCMPTLSALKIPC